MTTLATPPFTFRESGEHTQRLVSHRITRFAVPVGRVFFALIFMASGPHHFARATIQYAQSQSVPMAHILVPASGVLALLGGLSVASGFKARFGALLLVLFLVPVTLMMHNFWAIADAQAAMMQQVMFMKNVALLGGALILTHFGAGPISFDAMQFKARNTAGFRS